jgi:hypothetical protein
MAKSLLDELREHLEGVENYWVMFATILLFFALIAGLTLCGVYLYTRR